MSESDTQPEPDSVTEPVVDIAAGDRDAGEDTRSWTARHPALTYTLARFTIFLALVAIGLVIVDSLFVVLISAAILSSIISIFALRKQRDALSASIATRAERANRRMAERAASEDSWDDEQREPAETDSDQLGN